MENKELYKGSNDISAFCEEFYREYAYKKDMAEHLIKEYYANKAFFEEEKTIDDVIKSAFEFGWACRGNFDCMEAQRNKNEELDDDYLLE